jgi:hypothetical protein
VTHLRKMMLEELERRNYSAGTTRRYLSFVERFAIISTQSFPAAECRPITAGRSLNKHEFT